MIKGDRINGKWMQKLRMYLHRFRFVQETTHEFRHKCMDPVIEETVNTVLIRYCFHYTASPVSQTCLKN